MKDYVILTAGGKGSRMKSDLPKQFIELKRKPILIHTLERFFNYDNNLNFIITLPEIYISYWKKLCDEFEVKIDHQVIRGGETRFHSIKNALNQIEDAGLICIHDGVRPLVSRDTIKNTMKTALYKGNAVASQDIYFSVRKIEKTENYSVLRENLKEIQTPQVFDFNIIKRAYSMEYSSEFTDDATVVERLGIKINLAEGNRENIKITTEQDLRIAEILWETVF